MTRFLPLLVTLTLVQGVACAQTQTAAVAKAPAHKAAGVKTPPPKRHAPAAAAAAAAAPAPAPELAQASEEQLSAFQMAHLGDYKCEFKQSVHLAPLAGKPGYLTVAWQKLQFIMKPVLSPTGALRLEDVAGRALMIQIANKSMLLDTKIGQRLVDDCVHPEQARLMAEAKAAALANPAAVANNSLGIGR